MTKDILVPQEKRDWDYMGFKLGQYCLTKGESIIRMDTAAVQSEDITTVLLMFSHKILLLQMLH